MKLIISALAFVNGQDYSPNFFNTSHLAISSAYYPAFPTTGDAYLIQIHLVGNGAAPTALREVSAQPADDPVAVAVGDVDLDDLWHSRCQPV